MKVSYYPGCSLDVTAKPYDASTRAVCGDLGIELQEIPDWPCCGSSPRFEDEPYVVGGPFRSCSGASGKTGAVRHRGALSFLLQETS